MPKVLIKETHINVYIYIDIEGTIFILPVKKPEVLMNGICNEVSVTIVL